MNGIIEDAVGLHYEIERHPAREAPGCGQVVQE